MMTKQELFEKYKDAKKVITLEDIRGGFGTYSLDVNILKLREEHIKVTQERRTSLALKPAKYTSDDVYTLLVEVVVETNNGWKTIEKIYEEELHYNEYEDGDLYVQVK